MGFGMPRNLRTKTQPMTAKLRSCWGRQSMLLPTSRMAVWGAREMKGPPTQGRSTPGSRPRPRAAEAIAPPVEPIDTIASALPVLTRPVATATEARGFLRRARTGCSPSVTLPSGGGDGDGLGGDFETGEF